MTTSSTGPVETLHSPGDLALVDGSRLDGPSMETAEKYSGRTLIIEAGREESQYWRDLWLGRELLGFMVWRDIVVRYKQTVVGLAWSILRPFLTMVAGVFVFQYVLHQDSIAGVPYAVMVYVAVLPWQFFSDGLTTISASLLGNAGVITKIYFPRLMIPVSKLVVTFVDFIVSCGVLAVIMLWYHFVPGWQIVFLPLFILLGCATALGTGLWFAALNVKYRDFMYIVPFIVMFGNYICPVFFSTEKVYGATKIPEWGKFLYALNPMVSVIDGFRWCLLGGDVRLRWPAIAGSVVLVLLILASGHWYFRKTEATFADVI